MRKTKKQVKTPWNVGENIWIWHTRVIMDGEKMRGYSAPSLGMVTKITPSGRTTVSPTNRADRVYTFDGDGYAYGNTKQCGPEKITRPIQDQTIEEVQEMAKGEVEASRLLYNLRGHRFHLTHLPEVIKRLTSLDNWLAGLKEPAKAKLPPEATLPIFSE